MADGTPNDGIDNYEYKTPGVFLQAYHALLDGEVELNGSVRYDDHNIFGGITSPRFNVLWNHNHALNSRFAVGRGFRARPPSSNRITASSTPHASCARSRKPKLRQRFLCPLLRRRPAGLGRLPELQPHQEHGAARFRAPPTPQAGPSPSSPLPTSPSPWSVVT